MNKKGFTLVELLVVIAIIAILSIIIVPSVITINNRVNKRIYDGKVENIESSAELYASNNSDKFNGQDEIVVPVSDLIKAGYVTVDSKSGGSCTESEGCVINPTDNSIMNSCMVVITRYGTGYRARFYCEYSGDDTSSTGETLVDAVCSALNHGKLTGQVLVGSEYKECGCNTDVNATELVIKGTSTTVQTCTIAGSGPNNYLRYESETSSPNWRVLGLEKMNSGTYAGKIVPKIITSSPI